MHTKSESKMKVASVIAGAKEKEATALVIPGSTPICSPMPLTPKEDIVSRIFWLNDQPQAKLACHWAILDLKAQWPEVSDYIITEFTNAMESPDLYHQQYFIGIALDNIPLFNKRMAALSDAVRFQTAYPALAHAKFDVFLFGNPEHSYERVVISTNSTNRKVAEAIPPAYPGTHSFLSGIKQFCNL